MLDNFYSCLMFSAALLLGYFGTYCLTGKVPNLPIFKHYKQARAMMGAGFFSLAFMFLLHWIFELREDQAETASTINLTAYYLAAILFGNSFVKLLAPDTTGSQKLLKGLSKWLVFVVLTWSTILFSNHETINTIVFMLSTLVFLAEGINIILHFTHYYRKALRQMDDFYTEETAVFVHWISKSAYTLTCFGLLVCAINFMPKWCIVAYVVGSIFTFIYMFNGILNYLIDYVSVEHVLSEEDEAKVNLQEVTPSEDEVKEEPVETVKREEYPTTERTNPTASEREEILAEKVKKWVSEKRFMQKELTIEQMACEVNSNRTYVSSFINQHYGSTFREWIAELRIYESLEILKKEPHITTGELAERVGYSTQRTFNKFFNQYTNSTPKEWVKHI